MKKQYRFCYLRDNMPHQHLWQDTQARPFFQDFVLSYRDWWWEESWMIEDEFHREYTNITTLGDDLTDIGGIGERTMEALNKSHIYTFLQLGFTTKDELTKILVDNRMSKFRDPSNWGAIALILYSKSGKSQSEGRLFRKKSIVIDVTDELQ